MAEAQLTLRPVRHDDEEVVRAARRSLATNDFDFAVGWQPDMAWTTYIDRLDEFRRARQLPKPWVPATFLLAEVNGEVVGRTSVRHELNDHLLALGGHIGYAVLPDHRRRGYASEILRQSLVIARSFDVARVLVTCDEDNEASARVILRHGGALEDVVDDPDSNKRKQRYWIG
ncbi:GNAT family N-acetyltransferase [Ilumatobacter sp.]|uniref:GNAT family N-acetyltransferase n=1 Tax=Ilumatobacter sp. TaxID=1967498 RepID=UPI0037531D74